MDIVGRATQEAKAEDMESVATRIKLNNCLLDAGTSPA